jgi:predicted Zn-dependent peptidase
MIGWKKPTVPSVHDYAFDVISSALGSGKSSRLYKNLVLGKKLASSVYAWNGIPGSRYDSLFVVYAAPVEGVDIALLEKEIYAELDSFRKEFDQPEMERVKNLSRSAFIFMLDNNYGLAGQLSYCQTVFRDWRYIADYMVNLNRISIDDIHKSFDSYIRDSNKTVAVLHDSRSVK